MNRVLRTAMAKDPAERHPSAAAMGAELRAALALPDVGPPEVPSEVARAAAPAPAPAGSAGRGRLALVAGLVALVLLAGGGLAYALTRGGDSDRAATPASPRPSASGVTTPAEPSASSSSSGVAPSTNQRTAIDNFSRQLAASSVMSQEQSNCVATSVVNQLGLSKLVADGFFAEDLTFLDPDLADLPDEKAALSQATLSCLTLD
ncbi:hypothetical protein H5V45_12515 [Nocardioides sp. KIGAM211]|uniref:Uncharacterized protein n=1 Tax=Nocardioides luti TaxID=2761101 RepID=A0A7X0RJC9_9ACTN|nr:hypothetical protein [Nocardioides luti]MBB6628144.1 hypothetical protein [Nocardioides luti]